MTAKQRAEVESNNFTQQKYQLTLELLNKEKSFYDAKLRAVEEEILAHRAMRRYWEARQESLRNEQ